jgi:hypothetical protein
MRPYYRPKFGVAILTTAMLANRAISIDSIRFLRPCIKPESEQESEQRLTATIRWFMNNTVVHIEFVQKEYRATRAIFYVRPTTHGMDI